MIKRPMYDMLSRLQGRLALHTPGHRGQLPFGEAAPFDTTELPVTDDLYAPQGGIAEAEKLMALSAGAAASVFLCGGSTAGLQSLMLTYLSPFDQVILPRNAHHSAIGACVLGGFDAVFAPLSLDEDDYAYVSEESFLTAIGAYPKAKAVLVTRPDYYGGMIGLERIAQAAHAAGMKLIVDEAHGAHLNWMPGRANAGAFGADAWVQSAHKTLPALNAASIMHFKHAADAQTARGHLRLLQTASPSFPVLKSIDDARAFMDNCGRQRLLALQALADAFCQKAAKLGYSDARREDPTRVVLLAPQGGEALAQALANGGVDVEMYDHRRVVCLFCVMDTQETFDTLYRALEKIPPAGAPPAPLPRTGLPEKSMSVRDAYFARAEWVPIKSAAGRVAARAFGLYPPGIPLAVPGEKVSKEIPTLLSGGMSCFGVLEEKILCVKENG